jgi:hypothetical protein
MAVKLPRPGLAVRVHSPPQCVSILRELQGGRASVASRPVAGCVVTLSFPAAQNDEIVISA